MYTAAYRNARRASLFFLFCLLAALVELPLRGASTTSVLEQRTVSSLAQEERQTAAVISQALKGVRAAVPAAAEQNPPESKTVS